MLKPAETANDIDPASRRPHRAAPTEPCLQLSALLIQASTSQSFVLRKHFDPNLTAVDIERNMIVVGEQQP